MEFPGAILMGAKLRLLPPSIPYRFFGAAVVFHILMWGLLGLSAEDLSTFSGGPGLTLAAVHAATLGVLAMTAMGASFQILPVASGQAHRALWPCRLAFWLFVPGTAVLVGGMALSHAMAMIAGTAIGHGGAALAHVVLALYGFMGLLAIGFSHILIPMFSLANLPSGLRARIAFATLIAALVVAVAAALAPAGPPATVGLVAAAGLGLLGAGLHVHLMWSALKTGMRKRLGLSFVLVKTGWVMLLLGFPVAALAALDLLGDSGPALFGFFVLFGWLLTFLMGILQRVIPFLAAMNASKSAGPPPRLSELAEQLPLKIHTGCHFAALAAIAVGIVLDQGQVIVLGTSAGSI